MRTAVKPSAGFNLDLKIEYRDPTRLKLDPKNARRHSADQIAKLAATMATFGMVVPVLRDRDDNVVAGHGRVMAAMNAPREDAGHVAARHRQPIARDREQESYPRGLIFAIR